MIQRIYDDLGSFFRPKEVLILYGARRVGKTTIVENYLRTMTKKYRFQTGEDIHIQELLSSQDVPKIIEYATGYELLVFDEAQLIPNIGRGLKILIDQVPRLQIIATGSSSFDLANQIGEPLTGRKTTLILYPISQVELLQEYNRYDLKERLEEFLIFGSYPRVVTATTKDEKIRIIEELVGSYIFKDILALEKIKGSKVLLDLLKLLAFQIGQEVSLNELAVKLSLDVKTVGRYLDLLEKSFLIMRVGGFSRNLRSEIASKAKYYFVDTGIRNGVISQFNTLDSRNDVGQLWENFIVMERMKKRVYHHLYGGYYFWRTYGQQEIDFVEEYDGKLDGYEIKWSSRKEVRAPKDWRTHYPDATFAVITPENYFDFIT